MSTILDIYLHFLKTIFADSKSNFKFYKKFFSLLSILFEINSRLFGFNTPSLKIHGILTKIDFKLIQQQFSIANLVTIATIIFKFYILLFILLNCSFLLNRLILFFQKYSSFETLI